MNFLQLQKEFAGLKRKTRGEGARIFITHNENIDQNTLKDTLHTHFTTELSKLTVAVPVYNGDQEALEIRPEIQAVIIGNILQQIKAKKVPAKLPDGNPNPDYATSDYAKNLKIYHRYEELCYMALQEPAVREAYQATIVQNVLKNDAKNFTYKTGPANTKIAENLQYHDGVNANQQIDVLLTQINAFFETTPALLPSPKERHGAISLGNADPRGDGVVVNWPDDDAAQAKFPLNHGQALNLQFSAEPLPANRRLISPQGYSLEQDRGDNNYYLVPDTSTAASKFHYIMQQLNIAQEQYQHNYQNADADRKPQAYVQLQGLNELRTNIITETVHQAKKAGIKDLQNEVEPYLFQGLVVDLSHELTTHLNHARDNFVELLRHVNDAKTTAGLTDAQRIGFLHRALVTAIKNHADDAALRDIAIKYLVKIQGSEGAKALLHKLSKVGGADNGPIAQLNNVDNLFADASLQNIEGFSSKAVNSAMEDTINIINAKEFAKELMFDALEISNLGIFKINDVTANKLADNARAILNNIPSLDTVGEDDRVSIRFPVNDGDRALWQPVVHANIKEVERVLKDELSKSTSALRFSGHIFHANDLRALAKKHIQQLTTQVKTESNLRDVVNEQAYDSNAKKLKEKFSHHLKWGYLKFNLGTKHHEIKAQELERDLNVLAGMKTFGELARWPNPQTRAVGVYDRRDNISQVLITCGFNPVGQENQPIPPKVLYEAMQKLIIDEAKRVVEDQGGHYNGRHGAIKHGLKGRKGSSYLNDALLPTLQGLKPGMTAEARASYVALQQKMQLIAYLEGYHRIGQPKRGKQEWAKTILNDIAVVEFQMLSDFNEKRVQIAALNEGDVNVAGNEPLVKILKEMGYDSAVAGTFATAKAKATDAKLRQINGVEAMDGLQRTYEKHLRNLTLHKTKIVGGHDLRDSLKDFLHTQAKEGYFKKDRVKATICYADNARSAGVKVEDSEYERLGVPRGNRRT